MKSAALVNVALGQSDSSIRVTVKASKIGAYIDDNHGQLHTVLNISEMKTIEIIDFIRYQQVGTVYVEDVGRLSAYAGKIIALLAVLGELDIEVLCVADGGRVSGSTLAKLASRLAEQFERDQQLELGI